MADAKGNKTEKKNEVKPNKSELAIQHHHGALLHE